jgi:hypothetical protein
MRGPTNVKIRNRSWIAFYEEDPIVDSLNIKIMIC